MSQIDDILAILMTLYPNGDATEEQVDTVLLQDDATARTEVGNNPSLMPLYVMRCIVRSPVRINFTDLNNWEKFTKKYTGKSHV